MRSAQEGSPSQRASLFTIAVNLPFLDTLVAGIRAEIGDDALALSRITILLPTRRACRALREAFLRASAGWRGRKAALMAVSVLCCSALTWAAHVGLRSLLTK